MIKIEQLRYLIELDKTKSFHKCAQNLYLSQPAISLSIRNLEKELGAKLFQRTSTGVIPTEIGAAVIQQAREVLLNLNELYLICDKHHYQQAHLSFHHLTIYSPNSFSSVILPFLVPALQKEFPHATFSFHEYTSAELFAQIAENPYHIGFHYGWSEDDMTAAKDKAAVKIKPLYDISFYLAAAKTAAFCPKEPIRFKNAAQKQRKPIPLITFLNHAEIVQEVLQQLIEKNVVQITVQAPTTSLFYSYIAQGLSAGLSLKLGAHKFMSSFDLTAFSCTPIELEKQAKLFLVYHQDLPEPMIQLLIRHLDTYFAIL